MILIIHIVSALSSLALTGYMFLSPSKAGLKVSYALVAATLVTGTYLVLKTPTHLTQTCSEGLVYLAVVGAGVIAANKKLIIVSKQHAGDSLV